MSTRLNVNINDETASAIREAMERRQTTATEIVRRAVSVYAFLDAAAKRGDRIQLRDVDGDVSEVTFL